MIRTLAFLRKNWVFVIATVSVISWLFRYGYKVLDSINTVPLLKAEMIEVQKKGAVQDKTNEVFKENVVEVKEKLGSIERKVDKLLLRGGR